MSNYVSNRIICSKDFFYKYLYDKNPAGVLQQLISPLAEVSFNHLFSMSTIDQYKIVHGTTIEYDCGIGCFEINPDVIDIRFKTEWYYPIHAIIKAIQLDHSILWSCVEDNYQYISIFFWNVYTEKVSELIIDLLNSEEYGDHVSEVAAMSVPNWDDAIWHYGVFPFGDPEESGIEDLAAHYFERYSLQ